MDQFVLLMILLLGSLVSVRLGARFGLPGPVLMTLFGVALALVPAVPDVQIAPHLVLPLVLPPLLHAAARRTSWRQFAANWQPLVLLAVALVFVTTAAVAVAAHALLPGVPIAALVVLGALIAPPDPVAATAVAGSLGLPRRLVSLLEGEGLFNDVTAIVLYNVALAAAVGGAFHWSALGLQLLVSAVVAVAVGLALGWVAAKLMTWLGDTTLQVGLTLLVPFASYALADELHGSGVLAVLTTAFYLTERMADPEDIFGRLAGQTFWDIVETLVTGVAFGLIGLELRRVLDTAGGHWARLLGWSAVVIAVVVGVRLLWLVPSAWLARTVRRMRGADADIPLSTRETAVMWWAGMRGVASVALALAIPFQTDGGAPFPARDTLVFLAFAVILTTLLVQGLTLPWLVRALGVRADTAAERDLERRLALAASGAARDRADELAATRDLPDRALEMLHRMATVIGARISPESLPEDRRDLVAARLPDVRAVREVQGEMMTAARSAVLAARRDPHADPEVVDRVLRQLDAQGPH